MSTGGTAYVYYYNGKASYSADTYVIKSKIDTKYLYYFLFKKINHITFRYFIGSGLEHLQKDDLKRRFELLFPEKPEEQRKIAEILETVDNAIEKTDAIIEKYKRIKQGLMQDLLTRGIDENGQIRSEETHRFKDSPLGRIPEEWKVVELGEMTQLRNKKIIPPNGGKYIGLENIEKETGTINRHTPSEEIKGIANVFIKGDILFGKLRPNLKKYHQLLQPFIQRTKKISAF